MKTNTLQQVTNQENTTATDEVENTDAVVEVADELEDDQDGSAQEEEDAEEEEQSGEMQALTEERNVLKEQNDELQKKIDTLQEAEVIRIAGNLGIMPELIGEKDAKGFDDLANASRQVKALKKMVRRDEESFKIGAKEYSKEELYDLLDGWEEEESKLKLRYGSKMESAQKETMAIFRLGVAARAAKWVPGKKTSGEVSPRKARVQSVKKPNRKSALPRNQSSHPDFSKATDTLSLAKIIEKEFE